MRRLFCAVLIAFLSSPFPASCWWETGHQTVARIAAARLAPAARTRVARILDVPDTLDAVADGLAKASTWADETKNETKTGEWHYIDLTLQDQKSDIPLRCKDDNCAPARIRLFAAQLSAKTPNANLRWSDLEALRFLVHLVGDIHQPLHDISDADLGGNCEQLDPPIGKARNLHALWDGGIVDALDLNDKALAADLEKQIDAMSDTQQHDLAGGDANDWVWEGHELAEKDIYYKLHIPVEPIVFPANCGEAPAAITDFRPKVDMLYVDAMKPVVREQLAKAGLRLAVLLNKTL